MLDNLQWLHSGECVMLVRLVVAAILGGVVGVERGSSDRPAGLRTHILVCVGSALFTLVSIYGFDDVSLIPGESDTGMRRDSARIAAQVVSGIGFLGAGTIMHEGLTIRGLTTAASLWMVSAIGLAAGSGMLFIALIATIITLITLVIMHTWEKRFAATSRMNRFFWRIVANKRPGAITDITAYLSLNDIQVKSMNVRQNKEKTLLIVDLYIKFGKLSPDTGEIFRGVQELDGVVSVANAK